MTMLPLRGIAVAMALAVPIVPAAAHHSFAMFDPAKPMTFQATVKTLQWTAPHAILWVQAGPIGSYDAGLWSLELPTSPGNLSKMGWARTSLKAGDKVVVDINPMRDGRRAGQFKKVTIVATGKVLTVGTIPGVQPAKMIYSRTLRRWVVLAGLVFAIPAVAQTPADPVDPAPIAADWAKIAKLPDWSGTWSPDISDQMAQIKTNPVPWKPEVQQQVDYWTAEEKAGRPKGLLIDCLPHGTPTFILITHNALEFLFSPGRVTILGESDGNRLVRIYTDGRQHPADPDPSFHGHSIGHWEGDTLAVDTIAILPQVYLAVSEAVGIPNNGDMHVSQRIHLTGPDTLVFELEIDAPKILTRPWKTTRTYYRKRQRSYEIIEGVCRQGDFHDAIDKWGNAIFEPTYQKDGNVLPPPGK